jgi:hypothetical protein
MSHLFPAGLFFGFIGFILTLVGLAVYAWLHYRRPGSVKRWMVVPLLISAPGELLEGLGTFVIVMAVFNTITLRTRVIIESQFLLTLYLVILPILLSIIFVRGFNYLLYKLFIRKRKENRSANPHTVQES